jgi:hypothetical protein
MRFLKYASSTILFLYIVILFLPKESFYFFAEHKLAEYKIVLSNESLKDFGGIFTVKDPHVSYSGEDVGQIDTITILPFILYNEISINGLHFSKSLQNFIPSEIDEIKARITPFYPVKIFISSKGSFGEIKGSYNIYSKTIRLVLKPQENFRQRYSLIYSNFKDIEGELIYESSFK